MIPPILFVDDKEDAESNEYRYKKLERKLHHSINIIEFISDLELEYRINEYTDEVEYYPNPAFEFREAIFIHSSLNLPRYPETVINKAKSVHKNTIFSKFSNGRDEKANLRKEDLIFNRDFHIYDFSKNGFELFVEFYSQTSKLEYYFLQYGKDAFIEKINEADKAYKKAKNNIKDQKTLNSRKLDGNFMSIMRLADIYENEERLNKGVELIHSLTDIEEYFSLLSKYVRAIRNKAESDQKILKNILL